MDHRVTVATMGAVHFTEKYDWSQGMRKVPIPDSRGQSTSVCMLADKVQAILEAYNWRAGRAEFLVFTLSVFFQLFQIVSRAGKATKGPWNVMHLKATRVGFLILY